METLDLSTPIPPAHRLQVLDTSGHLELSWDPQKPEEVQTAVELFDRHVKVNKGMAFRVDKDGKKEQIRVFDPNAYKIQLVSQFVGG